VITKNGRPYAALMLVTKTPTWRPWRSAQNKLVWRSYDRARKCADKEGWTSLDDV